MADYKQIYFEYRGDSKVDTVPDPVGKSGYTRVDTDTRIRYQSDGTTWQIIGPITDTTKEKQGRVECLSYSELDCSGWFRDMQCLGSFSGGLLDGSGSSQRLQTGTAGANSWAGHYLIMPVGTFAGWTRPAYLPQVIIRESLQVRTSGDYRFIYGFWTGQALPATADGNPMDVNNGGVLVGFDSDDTNWQVYVGSGDGTTAPSAPIDTGIAVPNATQNRLIDIFFPTTTTCKIFILDGNAGTIIYNTTVSTNLPTTTKSLNFLNLINSPTNTNKSLTVYGIWGKATK